MLELNKIHQGDCLELMKGIENKSIDCIICDLPYGTTSCSWDEIIPFDKLWNQYNRIIKDNGAIVLFGSQPFTTKLINSNIKNFKYEWIWEKQKASNFMTAKYQPLKYHENVVVFSKGTHNYYPQRYKVLELGDVEDGIKNKGIKYVKEIIENNLIRNFGKIDRRKVHNDNKTNKEVIGSNIKRTRKVDDGYRNPKSIITINKSINKNIHPTQKPVELIEYLINTYSKEGDLILDNCIGSGTTAIACMNTGRNWIGMELDEEYYKLAKERIELHKKNLIIK